MRQTRAGGVLGDSLPRLEGALAGVVCGEGERFLGSSGRSERTGGGTVRTEVGEADGGVAFVGREAKGRSMGAGLEGVLGVAVMGDDEMS